MAKRPLIRPRPSATFSPRRRLLTRGDLVLEPPSPPRAKLAEMRRQCFAGHLKKAEARRRVVTVGDDSTHRRFRKPRRPLADYREIWSENGSGRTVLHFFLEGDGDAESAA
jgi:hypothetical protein